LARRLTLARHAAGLTQAVASRAVGVSQVHLCDVERGMSRPSEALVRRLLDLYGIGDVA
jgi:transcriptional regulator with XRE-family HTH domain